MIEVKHDGGLDWSSSSGSGENYFGYILKVDAIKFAGQLGCGKKGVEKNLRVSGLSYSNIKFH